MTFKRYEMFHVPFDPDIDNGQSIKRHDRDVGITATTQCVTVV